DGAVGVFHLPQRGGADEDAGHRRSSRFQVPGSKLKAGPSRTRRAAGTAFARNLEPGTWNLEPFSERRIRIRVRSGMNLRLTGGVRSPTPRRGFSLRERARAFRLSGARGW